MSEPTKNTQERYNALTEKMLSKMGFIVGQKLTWDDSSGGGEHMNFWIYGIELEISEEGSTSEYKYSVKLEDIPLVELLNKLHENMDTPIEVGTALTFDALESNEDYRLTRKITKRGTVVGIRVVVHDYRLRPSSFDPQFLKNNI